MTALTVHAPRSTGLFGRFGKAASDFATALREARAMARRYDRLCVMADSELARIGVRRSDIPQVVASGR